MRWGILSESKLITTLWLGVISVCHNQNGRFELLDWILVLLKKYLRTKEDMAPLKNKKAILNYQNGKKYILSSHGLSKI